jgi:hypothetical protein
MRVTVPPRKANPVLVVDADAVLAFPVAFERLQAIPGNAAKSSRLVASSSIFSLRRATVSNS